ncbi:MAG: hypothetical protein IIZ05_04385 [Firmicutes bacterium]|jgi:hypothetical protein|nr:hypothetical protein [Bacillota bacterium]MBQ1690497.1 hypothetical protein [Bacillota bacterium]MBR2749059.1 hypothetical protein [Bacillota bacterium]
MAVKQISIFVENKQGALAGVLEGLASRGVGLRAMTIADTGDFGILRIIVDDMETAVEALRSDEVVYSVTDVIACQAADVPGGFAKVLEILMDAKINIEYTYAFVIKTGEEACAIIRVDDVAAGEAALLKNGVTLISQEEVMKI